MKKNGELITFKGLKAYKNHLKSKRHKKNEDKPENESKLVSLSDPILIVNRNDQNQVSRSVVRSEDVVLNQFQSLFQFDESQEQGVEMEKGMEDDIEMDSRSDYSIDDSVFGLTVSLSELQGMVSSAPTTDQSRKEEKNITKQHICDEKQSDFTSFSPLENLTKSIEIDFLSSSKGFEKRSNNSTDFLDLYAFGPLKKSSQSNWLNGSNKGLDISLSNLWSSAYLKKSSVLKTSSGVDVKTALF